MRNILISASPIRIMIVYASIGRGQDNFWRHNPVYLCKDIRTLSIRDKKIVLRTNLIQCARA